jgi:AsmA protein
MARKALKIVGVVFAVFILIVAAGIAYVYSQFDAARIKAELARVVQEEKQRTLAIDGELELSFWPSLGVKLGRLRLSERASPQEFARVDKAHVSVAVMPLLSKRVVVDAVAVDGVKATLIKRKDGTLNIDDLMAKDKKEEGAPVRFDVASIKVANVQLDWRDEQTGRRMSLGGLDLSTGRVQGDTGAKTFAIDALSLAAKGKLDADSFEVKLQTPKLALAPGQSSAGDVTLDATLDGAQRSAKLKLALSGIDAKGETLTAGKLALDLDAKAGDANLKGRLESPLVADLGRRSVALDKLAGRLEIADARMPIKQATLPLAGALRADLARMSANGHLQTQFDESKIALKFDATRLAPPALAFDLDIDRLNLDKYLPKKSAAGAEDAGKDGAAKDANDEGKLDFSAIKGLDLNGTVSIGSFQVANVKATKVRLQIKAAGGKLDVAPHSASLYGGTATGALTLDANTNAIALRENLVGVDIQPLLKDAVDKDLLEGRGTVSLDVAGRGATMAAVKRSLHGSAALALKDGALKGINLAQSFRDLKAKFSSRQDAVQQAKATDKTDFSELAATFKIADGVARNDDLALKSPFLRVAGSGSVDIAKAAIDYVAKVSVVATAAGQGAKDLEHLKGLTVPVRASGPADNLSYRIEFAGIASEAVKAKVEEKTKEIKERMQEKALKGLFGK